MTEQILSNAKTNFDINLNNAITKRIYVSRMKKFIAKGQNKERIAWQQQNPLHARPG
jgi:hypothetical protein